MWLLIQRCFQSPVVIIQCQYCIHIHCCLHTHVPFIKNAQLLSSPPASQSLASCFCSPYLPSTATESSQTRQISDSTLGHRSPESKRAVSLPCLSPIRVSKRLTTSLLYPFIECIEILTKCCIQALCRRASTHLVCSRTAKWPCHPQYVLRLFSFLISSYTIFRPITHLISHRSRPLYPLVPCFPKK